MTDLDLHPLQSLISPYAQKGRPGLLPALHVCPGPLWVYSGGRS